MDGSPELLRILQVVLGIGLVIFVHELGHYLAARASGVRVEIFSLGIGPRLFSWRKGATTFQVAAFPIGGFCRMAGEERRNDGLPPQPDELMAKGVGKRFFIYSGGVLMNVAFGLVVFPILFRIGVPFLAPRIGQTLPGGPAWRAGVPEDSDVVSVNGKPVFDFMHIPTEVALGDPDRTELIVRDRATGEQRSFALAPMPDEQEGIRSIGVAPALERDENGNPVLDVDEGSPAWKAGLRPGDRLVEVIGGIRGLNPLEQLSLQTASRGPMRLRIASSEGVREVEIHPEFGPELSPPRIGISPPINLVLDVRDTELVRSVGLRGGDRVLAIQRMPILRLGDFQRALLDPFAAPAERSSAGDRAAPLEILVRRGGEELLLRGSFSSPEEALAFAGDVALVPDRESTEIVVHPGDPAEKAGLRTHDRVLQVDGADVDSWDDVFELVQRAGKQKVPARFRIARPDPAGGSTLHPPDVTVRPEPQPTPAWGLHLRSAQYLYRTESLGQAIHFGVDCSWKFLQDTWLTIQKMIVGEVPTKSIGGIITIGAVSYSMAEAGWVKLFFFLCLLSINLALFNILPIPVLDGGHLFFLIIEKIKGSPVSDRVLGYSQMIGVILILSLLVYVTYNDIVRVFGG